MYRKWKWMSPILDTHVQSNISSVSQILSTNNDTDAADK